MATKDKRYSVGPGPDVLAALGLDPTIKGDVTAGAILGAVERLADGFQAAVGALTGHFHRREWEFLADVMRCAEFPEFDGQLPAHLMIVETIERAQRDRRAGDRWFISAHDQLTLTVGAAMKRSDDRVKEVCDRIRSLSPIHGDAVLAAVRWYWRHHEDKSAVGGEWWLPSARKAWVRKRRAELAAKPPPAKPPALFEPEPDSNEEGAA